MVSAVRNVQIKCYGGSAEGEIPVVGGSRRTSWSM
jgi:hypothetical protein